MNLRAIKQDFREREKAEWQRRSPLVAKGRAIVHTRQWTYNALSEIEAVPSFHRHLARNAGAQVALKRFIFTNSLFERNPKFLRVPRCYAPLTRITWIVSGLPVIRQVRRAIPPLDQLLRKCVVRSCAI